MTTDDFPVQKEKLYELADTIKAWNRPDLKKSDRYVYVNLSMVRLQIMWILPKILYGLGIADAAGAGVRVITWKSNDKLNRLLEAFNIEAVYLDDICVHDPLAFIKAGFKTGAIMATMRTGDKLQKLRLWDIPVGKYVYEDIIRTSSLSTIKTLRNKICLKKIFHILWMLYSLNKYTDKYKPCVCISDDIAYHEAAQLAMMHKKGAVVFSQNLNTEIGIDFDKDGGTVRWGKIENDKIHEAYKSFGDEIVSEADDLLAKRFEGKNGRDLDRAAFVGKKTVSREELTDELGLRRDRKNIVIMAHTFTDAVFNYGELYFRDYYDWMEKTLVLAGKNDKVNWILKPHPSRKVYNESTDSIEKMYERLKKDHIYLLPDKVSAESIRNIADAIITIGGNAGGEFSCCGIPAIIVGKPYYKGFGYTIEPADLAEYERILADADSIDKLTEEQTKTAKKVFYLKAKIGKGSYKFEDDFAKLIRGKNKQMSDKIAAQLFESNNGTQDYNDDIIISITDYFKNNRIEDTSYYRRGYERGSGITK